MPAPSGVTDAQHLYVAEEQSVYLRLPFGGHRVDTGYGVVHSAKRLRLRHCRHAHLGIGRSFAFLGF